MAKKFHQPTRMCVSCRIREPQCNLLRLQCFNGELTAFDGTKRSFYLCQSCLKEEKKLLRALMRQCKSPDKDKLMNKLKEIITDDRKS
ncbi:MULTISPECIES: DUF448 domain-containing protein [Sulfurimonas]|uniref:DUF448 domain-containing protein n=1 Tax=Sulfurimonas sediminis TaxID=2590020 RepID=A0A7M1B0R1_9BACT|nr:MULTISPECIES: DUF448 domain-containing protein [Sulfurimonas]QOP43136.1 DUF448 domain-containing protein [Sulfurimonas sediminis]UCN01030.1 DUF448 domain-containing protein [Sulfurimonas sp. SWIR-19]